jgi:hypothetical protein
MDVATTLPPHMSVMHGHTVISGQLHVCFVTDMCTYVVWISFKSEWVQFVVFTLCVSLSQIYERTKFHNLNIHNVRVHSISFVNVGTVCFLHKHLCFLAETFRPSSGQSFVQKVCVLELQNFQILMSSVWRPDLLMVWKFMARTHSLFLCNWYSNQQMCKWELVSLCKVSCNWISSWKNTVAVSVYFTKLFYFVL